MKLQQNELSHFQIRARNHFQTIYENEKTYVEHERCSTFFAYRQKTKSQKTYLSYSYEYVDTLHPHYSPEHFGTQFADYRFALSHKLFLPLHEYSRCKIKFFSVNFGAYTTHQFLLSEQALCAHFTPSYSCKKYAILTTLKCQKGTPQLTDTCPTKILGQTCVIIF